MGYPGLLYICEAPGGDFHVTVFDPEHPGDESKAKYKIIDGKELPSYLKNFFVSVADRC